MVFFVMNEKAAHKNKIIFPIVLLVFSELEFYFVLTDIWFNIERIDIIADSIDEQIVQVKIALTTYVERFHFFQRANTFNVKFSIAQIANDKLAFLFASYLVTLAQDIIAFKIHLKHFNQ